MIVTVTRTGGFAGMTRTGELDTAAVPDGRQVEQAIRRIDPAQVPDNQPQPDRYRYRVVAEGTELSVAEQDLDRDSDLAWLVDRVLRQE